MEKIPSASDELDNKEERLPEQLSLNFDRIPDAACWDDTRPAGHEEVHMTLEPQDDGTFIAEDGSVWEPSLEKDGSGNHFSLVEKPMTGEVKQEFDRLAKAHPDWPWALLFTHAKSNAKWRKNGDGAPKTEELDPMLR